MIIQKEQNHGQKIRKSYIIYAFAELVDNFHGRIEVTFDEHLKSFDEGMVPAWEISTPGNRFSPEQTIFIQKALEAAQRLVAGDESEVSTDEQVQALFDAVKEKDEQARLARQKDKEEYAACQEAARLAKIEAWKEESNGKEFFVSPTWDKKGYVIKKLSTMSIMRSGVTRRSTEKVYATYKSAAKACESFNSPLV